MFIINLIANINAEINTIIISIAVVIIINILLLSLLLRNNLPVLSVISISESRPAAAGSGSNTSL